MKRTLCLVLSLVLFCSIFSCLSVTVNAASASDLIFTLNSDGKSYYLGLQDTSLSGALNIPSTYNGKPVTSIADNAFIDCVNLTSVTIPNSVTSIGKKAFWGCKNLSSITVPDSVTSIGGFAFSCTAYDYNSKNWQNSVLYIGNHLTDVKESLSGSYTIKNGTKTIAGAAFFDCTALTSITIPNSVVSIGDSAFSQCVRLSSVTIGEGVTSIGEFAFLECTSLKDVYYSGTKAQRQKILINSSGNDYLKNAEWHFCNNGHTEVKDAAIAPDCTTPGKTEGSHCSVCNKVIIAQTTIPATGHTYTSNVTKPATHTSTGVKTYTCGCGYTYTETIAKTTEHTYTAKVTAPTCTAKGYTTYTCNCGDTYVSDYVNAKGHTTVKDAAVSATCTTAGKTEGSHCSVCNIVIKAQTTIPATGHTSSDWIIDANASYTNSGSKHTECTVCGETLQTTIIPQLAPLTPTTKVTSTFNGIQISWNAVAGATKYVVYRRNAGSSTWTAIGTTTSSSLVDKNVTAGKYYIYSIRAYNAQGSYSAYVSAKTKTIQYILTPTAVATNLANGVQIKWNSVAGATKYNVYRRVAGSSNWVILGTTTGTSLVDKGVTNGKYYVYSIRAINGTGYSAFDTTKTDTIQPITAPSVKVVNKSNGVHISWNAVPGATKYNVYRRLGGTSTWIYVATTTSTGGLDKGVTKGKSYAYSIRAINGTGYSAYDSSKCASIKYS